MMHGKRISLIIALAASTVLLLFISFWFYNEVTSKRLSKSTSENIVRPNEPAVTPVEPRYGLPLRLKISKLNIDANIVYVGLTGSGNMESPVKLEDLGWYKYGPHPGDKGTAVIAGHLDGVKDPGVFIDLNKLQTGDSITITDGNGQIASFTVSKTQTYNSNEQPKEVFSQTDKAKLNLITCAGTWDPAQKQFSKRLVVFADKVL